MFSLVFTGIRLQACNVLNSSAQFVKNSCVVFLNFDTKKKEMIVQLKTFYRPTTQTN